MYTVSFHTDYHKACYDNISYHIADDHTFNNHKVVYNANYHSTDYTVVLMSDYHTSNNCKFVYTASYYSNDYDSDSYHSASKIILLLVIIRLI